jgi:hypothetical protein
LGKVVVIKPVIEDLVLMVLKNKAVGGKQSGWVGLELWGLLGFVALVYV